MKDKQNLNIYFEKLLRAFVETFSVYKEKRIVLYGIGAFSATVIEYLEDFHIVGLMDRDPENIGKVLYGVPILSKEQAEEKADLIIINTEAGYWQTIYKRICGIRIPVYYRSGQEAYLDETPTCDASLEYWNSSGEKLMHEINRHTVISFDIFDTLVTRKIYLPADVFELVELRLRHEYHLAINFRELRTKALHTTGAEEPDYDEIYEQFRKLSGLNEETAEKIKRLEFEIEMQLLTPRKEMVQALDYAKKMQKQVILVSDMYYSGRQLEALLDRAGISGYDEIFVSCEYRKTKQGGLLYDEIFRKYGKEHLLHIGDNRYSDYEVPREKGADAFYIMSGRDLLGNSSVKNIIPQISTLTDSLSIGIVLADIFNSPFALCETKGILCFADAEQIGYSVFAPLIFGFTHWLWKSAVEDKVEKLLFFARDGYFLKGYFQRIQEYGKCGEDIEAEYFMISRRLAGVASIHDKETFLEVAKLPYKGTFPEYMEKRWNVHVSLEDEWSDTYINTAIHFEELFSHMMVYKDELAQSIRRDRENYKRYCQEHTEGKRIAVVDTWYYGTCQWYLSQILNKSIQGYYFGANLTDDNRNNHYNTMSACYNDKKNPTGGGVRCMKDSLYFESVFTAPHGMVRSCEGNGKFSYEPKGKNQQEFWLREKMDSGVTRFFEDFMEILGEDALRNVNFHYPFCDEMYGTFIGETKFSKEIRSRLYNENYFQSSEEFLIAE